MSYQVLARKWRPRTFKELVGQVHVLQALVNALDNDRLHHAYLFTGTRGVGKTTIARILAKCLNCETGVTSEPCGECDSCREIDEGRFVDLIEVDAASRTRLEDTKELLDNVQYAPTRGRFKVYLIDEVHMLSTHSFNALLKTLEEPPPHIKFLLATTDPHKLPITILSRCLQFSLKNMPPERVVGHLQNVLDGEHISYELPALWQLGRAADGSMRDALSLTDQAIAYCGEGLTNQGVTAMLGTIDQAQVYRVLDALADGRPRAVLDSVSELSEHSPDYVAVLADMLSALHRVALAQALPDVVDNSQGDREQILNLAGRMTAEDVQLYYQTGLIGRRDLPLSPDPRSGFEMVLLRMLAFRPDGIPTVPEQPLPGSDSGNEKQAPREVSSAPESKAEVREDREEPEPSGSLDAPAQQEPVSQTEPQPQSVEVPAQEQEQVAQEPTEVLEAERQPAETIEVPPSPAPSQQQPMPEPVEAAVAANDAPPPGFYDAPPLADYANVDMGGYENEVRTPIDVDSLLNEPPAPSQPETVEPQAATPPEPSAQHVEEIEPEDEKEKIALAGLQPQNWIDLSQGLRMGGVTGAIVSNCEMVSAAGNKMALRLDSEHDTLYNDNHRMRIEQALSDYFGEKIALDIQTGVVQTETPSAWRERRRRERLEAARRSFHTDERVQAIVEAFSGTILDHTIEPVGS
ncbi:DNA polymerase III subunit gamma/tau [Sansalvadorimonas sp. 2012CJ34-2]|uniref:DNA polymerase III subunit gamma/tau n=1 Tax=Parendozoicomonas callyspongiae TaxID=2942213 RepID=A0ABT0PJE9_9GAMM|nr:DNA polymerase III subunit gamma/tau [Sansalvadorimonas sp. 2012CJ34-2]MCL6271488.1 DNA polymerase III subunit gamma/tau [Sansalvadorimonas sp. 2012CJ34-2]